MDREKIISIVRRALEEDAAFEDITSELVVDSELTGKGRIIFKEPGVLCGTNFAEEAFRQLDENVEFVAHYKDGEHVIAGSVVAEASGKLRAILSAERVALNFISYLSGISTLTSRFVEKANLYGVKVYDTRKTHPGLRDAEKYAVRIGGGYNHRFSLKEAVFIKDNHIVAAGSLENALRNTVRRMPGVPLIVEVGDVNDAKVALEYKPDVILCDNLTPDEVAEIVRLAKGISEVEASGGITYENLEEYLMTGIDRISLSAITMNAKSIDVSLELSDQGREDGRKFLPE